MSLIPKLLVLLPTFHLLVLALSTQTWPPLTIYLLSHHRVARLHLVAFTFFLRVGQAIRTATVVAHRRLANNVLLVGLDRGLCLLVVVVFLSELCGTQQASKVYKPLYLKRYCTKYN